MTVALAPRHVLTAALLGAVFSSGCPAQTPGQWRYVIATDLTGIAADMRVNFPTIQFDACRNAGDFSSGRAFALQTLASSTDRCPSTDFERSGAGAIRFRYACDGGRTLDGSAEGRVSQTRFTVTLLSRYTPASQGIEQIRQTMSARRIGPCRHKAADDNGLKP